VRLNSHCHRVVGIHRANWTLVAARNLAFFMSHVALFVLLAVDKCTLMERDSLCAEWAIQILNLATFMTFKSSDEGLPGLAPLWY